ncbi:hypothetical protein NQ314_006519 [Rhamnusium bicolor]|uniref:Uncharacterized protein n=1 Tax=Rhamnusium bicolor TaxID=1586634 RepID=A0AAV8Z1V3_9CUCU|nr:hypothetical protein NQ314_006519 [Rhamnusium bicolor]
MTRIVSHFSSQRRQKSLPIGNGKFANIKPTSNVSDNIEQEELNEYGNTINQDNLVLLLTKELRQRNLQQEAEEQSSFTDTDFEDEDNDQPLYDNTSSPIDMTRNTSRIGQERHDDEQDQPVYDNTPTLQFNNNTSANLDADEEISEDVDIPSYKNIEDSIRIFKRPLPDIPKKY